MMKKMLFLLVAGLLATSSVAMSSSMDQINVEYQETRTEYILRQAANQLQDQGVDCCYESLLEGYNCGEVVIEQLEDGRVRVTGGGDIGTVLLEDIY